MTIKNTKTYHYSDLLKESEIEVANVDKEFQSLNDELSTPSLELKDKKYLQFENKGEN